MTMIDREIAEFGRRMGMPGFTLAGGDMAALDIDMAGMPCGIHDQVHEAAFHGIAPQLHLRLAGEA